MVFQKWHVIKMFNKFVPGREAIALGKKLIMYLNSLHLISRKVLLLFTLSR